MTFCGFTCQEQEEPGQGQLYGLNSQTSSCSAFSFKPSDIRQPVDLCLHGNMRLFATFSIAKLRMFPGSKPSGKPRTARVPISPRAPRHVGQHDSFGRQLEQTRCPTWHCIMGGSVISKQTGHSKSAASSSVRVAPLAGSTAGNWLLPEVEVEAPEVSPLPLTPRRFTFSGWAIWEEERDILIRYITIEDGRKRGCPLYTLYNIISSCKAISNRKELWNW